MRTHTPLFLLAALGVLSIAAPAAAAVDTSDWKCESCPYPKGMSGTVEAGIGVVSDASAKFGDYTGLQRQGAHLVLGGAVNYRGGNGYYADLYGSDLGLDSRTLAARTGREGLYSLRLGYSEIPRHFADDAVTPFLGSGGSVLTLPAGFPASTTATMPLATSLQPVDLGLTLKRYELGGSLIAGNNWTYRISLRRDVRDGTRPVSASFFSTAVQMAAPVDQVTDQFEVAAAYVSRRLQATLAYQVSQFRNDSPSLTWDNPFTPVLAGATRGQLALAPDNQFHQVLGSVGYEITPTIRASADFAVGRMTQDAAYLASTSNAVLAPSVPALPATSLDGRVNTFSSNLRLTATPIDGLRVNAVYSRDVRDNRTTILSYPQVTTDLFLNPLARSNTPFSFWRDRFKLNASYRGPGTLRLSAGLDQDNQQRSYQEVVDTRETTLWGRAGFQPRDDVSLALKLAHSERHNSPYGVSTWFGTPENPLLRKYNLADRQRNSVGARADVTVGEKWSLGLTADYSNDDYSDSAVGLQEARSVNVGADLAYALSERTQLHAFAQGEQVRSKQAGSQSGLAADWSARNKDRFEILGLGVKHAAIPEKLDIGADLSFSRSRSDITVDAGASDPSFPTAKTALDSLKLYANYKLNDKTTLTGTYWYENYDAQDWRLDGVLPSTVSNLLSFGQQAPQYRVHLVRVSVRYRF